MDETLVFFFPACRESFIIRNLIDCKVYLLDYTSEVEVTNCRNCQIFIGPVDGPAIFDGNTNCTVSVACQQFQAKGTENSSFSLYCATGPSLSNCSQIILSCWNGSYPGLKEHFAAANLDPTKNRWYQVYDASTTEGNVPNFQIVSQPSTPWDVPIEGSTASSENPVPFSAPDQQGTNVLGNFVPQNDVQNISDAFDHSPFPGENGDELNVKSTHELPSAAEDAAHRLETRLASQTREESDRRSEIQMAAAKYLEEFYAKRKENMEKRTAKHMNHSKDNSGEDVPNGETIWQRTVSLIDFNMPRPNGADLSRFKSVLLSCAGNKA